ncbi:MAG: GNAT family N-acetyltransferase [Pseudomonadota bacterium]
MNTGVTIRRARADEAEALAHLHVSVWRETYRDYAPAEAIRLLDEARRLPYWIKAIAEGAVFVADGGHDPLGVVSFGPSEHAAFGGRVEIKHLYVARTAQGMGLGRRLLKTVLSEAAPDGVALAVVRQNEAARRFYAQLGGVERGAFIDPGPLWRSENIVVAWDSETHSSPSNP